MKRVRGFICSTLDFSTETTIILTMKTRPNKNIKKLSTAMRRGLKIAKEKGIKPGKYELATIDWDEETDTYSVGAACALGMAYIGINGTKKARGASYTELEEQFPKLTQENKCLVKAAKRFKLKCSLDTYTNPEAVVITMNDSGVAIEKIADKLEKCGL